MTCTVPALFNPRDYQLEVFQAMDGIQGQPETKKKRVILRWHRRAGKDECCLSYLAKEAAQTPGEYYYFFPYYQQGRLALWEKYSVPLGDKLIHQIPRELIKRKLDQDMMLELHNGSIVRVIGTDNIDRIVGTNPIGCVFSEYSLQDKVAWAYISPILAENGGWAIFNWTPRGRNHAYHLEVAARSWPRWFISVKTVDDTGLINTPEIKSLIDEARVTEGEDFVQQEYYVEYSAGIKGAIYSTCMESARTESRVGSFPYDANKPVETFWDLGLNDSMSIFFRQLDGNRNIFFDYWEGQDKSYEEVVEVLADKGYNYRNHYLPWDGSKREPSRKKHTDAILREMMRDRGVKGCINVTKRCLVQDGIRRIKSLFTRFYFNEPCAEIKDAIEMLTLYHRKYDKSNDTYSNEPVHDWTSHCADALRTVEAADRYEDGQASDHNAIKVIREYDAFEGYQ